MDIFRRLEVLGLTAFDPERIDVRDRRGLDNIPHAFEPHPQARRAAHRPAMNPIVEVFLNIARVQDGNERRNQQLLALVRKRGRLGRVIVGGQHDRAAMRGSSSRIGMLEGVRASVDAGPLAVPHSKHAIDRSLLRVLHQLLGSPAGGRSQVFVETRDELNLLFLEQFLDPPKHLVQTRQRRPAVATDEPGGVQPCRAVASALVEQQPDQRLRTTDVGGAAVQLIAVLKLRRTQQCSGRRRYLRHAAPPHVGRRRQKHH
jgi:hypothetical protein